MDDVSVDSEILSFLELGTRVLIRRSERTERLLAPRREVPVNPITKGEHVLPALRGEQVLPGEEGVRAVVRFPVGHEGVVYEVCTLSGRRHGIMRDNLTVVGVVTERAREWLEGSNLEC